MAVLDAGEFDSRRPLYDACGAKMREVLGDLLERTGIEVNSITYRVKGPDSLRKKLDAKNYHSWGDCTDLLGLRVITYYHDDVDAVADIIDREFIRDYKKSTDKRVLDSPDRFGYRSLHYIVQISANRAKLPEYSRFKAIKFEVQIRSVLQHAWAEIEHDLGYKSSEAVPAVISRKFSRLSGLLELADEEFAEIRKMVNIRQQEIEHKVTDLTNDEILLDLDSLTAYMQNSSLIREMAEEMARGRPVSYKRGTTPARLHMRLIELKSIGIVNVLQLERALRRNRVIIRRMGLRVKKYDLLATLMPSEASDARTSDAYRPIPSDLTLFCLWACTVARMPPARRPELARTHANGGLNFGALESWISQLDPHGV